MDEDLSMAAVGGMRPLLCSDLPLFAKAFSMRTSRSCECSFANLILWRDTYDEVFFEYAGRMVVVEKATRLMHFPIGEELPPKTLASLAARLKQLGLCDGGVYDVPETYWLTRRAECAADFEAATDEGAFDYLYDLEKLAGLSGPLLRKKRNLVRQFHRGGTDICFEDITEDNLDAVLDLAGTLNRRLPPCDFLEHEAAALAAVRRYFRELQMGGLLLLVKDTPVGFSLYSRIDDDTWDIHFEKADHSVKGASQALTAELAKRLLARGGSLMNREQDMNEPGLRQAKRSLDPCGYFRRVFLTLKPKRDGS